MGRLQDFNEIFSEGGKTEESLLQPRGRFSLSVTNHSGEGVFSSTCPLVKGPAYNFGAVGQTMSIIFAPLPHLNI